MVREFTELQGTMGGIYAREEGLPEEIWKAIYFHYLPVGVESDAPPTKAQLGKAAAAWAAVSLADKLDTIVGLFFKANERPFFVLTPQPTCVAVETVDAATAAPLIRQTRQRLAGRPIEYDMPKVTAQSKATPSSAVALTTVDSAAKDQIDAATAAWVDAFNKRDAARLNALYDAEAVLSDAAEPRPRVGSTAIGDYYKTVAKRPTHRVALGERSVRLLGDTAIDSGTLTYFEMRDGNATTTPGRYSLTYQKRGGKWLIVDHQTSVAAR